jgi:ribonuclease P protein component
MGEETVPAEQQTAGQAPRVQAPHVDARGTIDPQGPAGQGSRPAVGLIWRVRDQATFRSLRYAPRVKRGPLTVAWLDDGAVGPPRVAFAVGRRVGAAVVRNRVRRRLRDLARRSALPGGVWFVSGAAGAGAATFGELAQWWDAAVADLVRVP